ncbi:MAG: hypothetical protein KDK12_16760 [Rhodobacteraceae bacterium]|nr:hypothetical protein [Paracoccaceae bacterium]
MPPRTLLVALALTFAPAGAQAECQRVFFQPGAYSAQVWTTSYNALVECFFLDVRPGQAAHVRILQGADTTFETPETGPDQIDTQYTLTSRFMEVYLHKTHPYPDREPVLIEFSVW